MVFRLFLVPLLVVLPVLVLSQEDSKINVTVDGDPVKFKGIGPRVVNGRVLVPMRGIFETYGAYVGWDKATQTVGVSKDTVDVQIQVGASYAKINGEIRSIDVPARIVAGSTLVPLRFISEALGARVVWDGRNQAIVITTADVLSQIPTAAGRKPPP